MIDPKNCRHPTKAHNIIKFRRKNYPFGKKSGVKHYSVRMCKEVCEECGTELGRWKPAMILFFSILILFSSLNFISANGLILNTNNFTLSQTYNTTQSIILSITNTEPNTFYNISIENNPYITFPVVSQLSSGQTINFSANIITTSNFNGNLKIKGYYLQNVGIQNKSWSVNINYPDGVDNCSLSLIKGDKVTFHSNVNDNVNLRNQQTGNDITTIPALSNYTINFDNPQILDYQTQRIGFPFGPTCRINCLDDSGYVNNPLLDGILNINLAMSYPPTSLNFTQYINNYTVNFFDVSQDVISITNTGTNVAKNITLLGNWFSFNKNQFDLNPGQTTTIVYTMKPKIGYTNDTNKTWSESFNVSGNFPSINIPFNIFINYANIDSGNLNLSGTNQSFMDYVCTIYPQFCQNNTIIVYRTVDNDSIQYNVSVGQNQLNQIFQKQFSEADQRAIFEAWVKEQQNNNTLSLNQINTNQANLNSKLDTITANQSKDNNFWFFFYILISLAAMGCLIGVIGFFMIKQRNAKKKEIW